jgi:hypothetical protein
MSITSFDQRGGGFLSFNKGPPRLYVTSALPAPEKALADWSEEGYEAEFIPYDPASPSAYIHTIRTLNDSLNLGDNYALIAYGDAASVVLKTAQKPLEMLRNCRVLPFAAPEPENNVSEFTPTTNPRRRIESS